MDIVTSRAPVTALLDRLETLIRNGPGVAWAPWDTLPEWAEGEACPADHLWEAGMILHRGDVASEADGGSIVIWNDGDAKDYVPESPGLVWEVPLAVRVIYGRMLSSAEAESMSSALFSLFCADLESPSGPEVSKALDRLSGTGVKADFITDADCTPYADARNHTHLDLTFTVRCRRVAVES